MPTAKEQDQYLYSLSVDEQKAEYLRCKDDPAYFIEHYARIRHPMKGLVQFELWDFQKEILEELRSYRNNLYVKSRQLGLSTLVACYSVWFALFHRQKSILILAIKRDIAANLLEKVKLAYNELPSFFKKINPEVMNNTTRLLLKNGSEIKCVATTKSAVRSEALSLLIFDEAAFIEDVEVIWTAAKPALDSGGSCIVLSSPNGEGNWFHEQYLLGEHGGGTFHVRKLMWDLRPDRDALWLQETKASFLKEEDFEQEYCCSFLSSGRTVIPAQVLSQYREKVVPPIKMMFKQQSFWVWEEYKKGSMYFATVDVSRGDGEDYSVVIVWKAGSVLEQVAEYRDKIKTSDFGQILVDIGKMYGECLMVVENNSYGVAVLNYLESSKYSHLFYMHRELKKNEPYNPYKNYKSDSNYKLGIFTSAHNRDYFMLKFEEILMRNKVRIYSKRLVDELYTFIWKNGKRAASTGNNDDLVMALSFAAWVWIDVFQEKYERHTEFERVSLADLFSVSSRKIQSTDKMLEERYRRERNTLSYEELLSIFKGRK